MPVNPIYDFLKQNGLTDKDEQTFLNEYSNPDKAKELYGFLQQNNLTDKGFDDFYGTYLKKKDIGHFQGFSFIYNKDGPHGSKTDLINQQHQEAVQRVKDKAQKQQEGIQKLNEPLFEQPKEDDPDWLGTANANVNTSLSNLDNKLFQEKNRYATSDNTIIKHSDTFPVSDHINNIQDLTQQKNRLLAISKGIENTVNKTGLDIPDNEAKSKVTQWVQSNPQNQNIDPDRFGIDEIKQLAPKDLTSQAILKTYENNRYVRTALSNSNSFNQAVIKWAKQAHPELVKDLDAQTNGTDDPTLVSNSQLGSLTQEFLQQPFINEYAKQGRDQWNAVNMAKRNWVSNFPKLASAQIATKLSNEKEAQGLNNGVININDPSHTDVLAKKMYDDGKLTFEEYQRYQKDKLNIFKQMQDSGFVSSVGNNLDHAIYKALLGNQEMWHGIFGIGNNADDVRTKNEEKYLQSGFDPKGVHGITYGSGKFVADIAPIMVISKGLTGLGMSSKVANGVAMALTAEHDTRMEALDMFPDDPTKRNLYTGLVTLGNGLFGSIVSREKPLEGIEKIIGTPRAGDFKSDVLKTINEFTEGKITADAAKESYLSAAKKFIDNLPKYTTTSLKHNVVQAGQMMMMNGAQMAASQAFGGRDYSLDDYTNSILATGKMAFFGNLPLSVLSAHADITNESKIGANAVYEMASDPLRYNALIDNLAQTDGQFSKRAFEIKENLNTAVELKNQMDNNPMLGGLKPEDKQKYLFQSLSQKILEKKLETTTDNVLRKKIKEQIKQSENFNQRLVDKTPLDVTKPSKQDEEKGVKPYYDDEKNVTVLADKIKRGQPLTDDDLQLQQNFPKELEIELGKLKNNNDAVPIEKPDANDVRTTPSDSETLGRGNEKETSVNEEITGSQKENVNDAIGNQKESEILQSTAVGENTEGRKDNLPVSEGRIGETQGTGEEAGKTTLEPYTTKNGKYTVSYEEGKRVVKDANGKVPSEKVQKKVLSEHAENFNYNNKEEIKSEPPQFNTEQEADRWQVENSTNPSEIADAYLRSPKEPAGLSNKEQAIRNGIDAGILGKVKESDYNHIKGVKAEGQSKARAWFSEKSQPIDVIAKEISDHTGVEVSPEDVANFIDKFPNGEYQSRGERDTIVHQMAKQRFEELTGIPLTDKVAKMAAKQYYEPEQVAQAEINVDQKNETSATPEEEILKWLTEESQKEYDNSETIDNLDNYEQLPENIGKENTSQPETQGGLPENTRLQEGASTSTDLRQPDNKGIASEQQQVSESGTEDLEQSSTSKSYQRIPVEPIVGEAKKLSDIIHSAGNNLQQRILYLKPGQDRRRALGTYSPSNKGVKIKYEGDLDTTAHELGHAIDDQYSVIPEIEKNATAVKELEQFADFGSKPPKNHPNPDAYIRAEGFAEWLRAYVVNPKEAKKLAPEVTNIYESTLPDETKKAISDFSDDVRAWAGATGKDMILSNVEVEAKKNSLLDLLTKKESSNEFSVSWLDKVAANFTNPLRVFEKAFKYAKGLKGVDEVLPENDPIILARILNGIDGKFGEILKTGMIDAEGNVIKVGGKAMDIKWLLEPLDNTSPKDAEKSMEDVIGYMIAERTVELGKRFSRDQILTGIGGGIYKDVDVAKKALNEYNSHPRINEIKEAADRYRKYADATLKYMVDKGRMSKDQYDEIKANNLQYVALQRVIEAEPNQEVVVFQGSGGKSIGAKADPIKKIKGSTKKISNPYVSLIDTLYKSVKEADRNEVLQAFRDMVYEKRGMNEGEVKRLSDIAVIGKPGDKNAITIFVDGKPEHWVFQQDIYKAIKNLEGDAYKLPGIVTMPAKLLRATVTNFPLFALRNWVRDFQDRIIKSNNNKGLSAFTNIVGKGEDWHQIARMGGLNTGFYMKDRVSYYGLLKEAMHDMSKRKNVVVDAVNFKHWYEKYHGTLYKSETSNRVAEYRSAFNKYKAKGYDDYNASLKAAYEARDLIDFAVMGHWMKVVNQIIPFSNAAIQGMRSTVVKAKENPLGFAARTVLYSIIPQAIMWYLNHRDDDTAKEYESLPAYQRDMFWNFKVGADNWLSVPKPYELSLAAASTDRLMSQIWGNNKDAFDGYGGTILKSLLPVDESAITGPYRALFEVWANKDFFRGKYIIPPNEVPLNIALRHTENASRLSKLLQKVSGVDARYLDHFISSQFSYFGNFAEKLSNIGTDNSKQKLDLTDLGFFKHSPGYNSPKVQEMLSFAKEWSLTRSNEYQQFSDLAQEYFNAKDSKTKDQLADNLVDMATNMLKVWKEDKVDQKAIDKFKKKNAGK